MTGRVISVAADDGHRFSKRVAPAIRLLAGLGVEGDAHCGVTVRHRSRVAADPTAPNLRQLHLMQSELFDELRPRGFDLAPGDLGENILTRGLDLLALPRGARLAIGATAIVELTGLRNPCAQIENFRKGLLAAVLDRATDGTLVRKAGVLGIVIEGGDIVPGDAITVTLPDEPWQRLERV
jgi:MOSC domain-containing protein YiiM